jgi:hypothetical protein
MSAALLKIRRENKRRLEGFTVFIMLILLVVLR